MRRKKNAGLTCPKLLGGFLRVVELGPGVSVVDGVVVGQDRPEQDLGGLGRIHVRANLERDPFVSKEKIINNKR